MAAKKTSIDRRIRARIRDLRVAIGLTQEGLSEKADISLDAVNRIEHGSRVPTLETTEKIANALNVSIGELLDPDRPPPPPGLPAPLNQLVALLGTQPAHVQEASLKLTRVLVGAVKHDDKR